MLLSTVYQVLLELKRKLLGRDFIRMVSSKPLASNLLQVYCRQQDRNFLKDFYYQDDRAEETAYVTLLESYESKVRGRQPRLTLFLSGTLWLTRT